MTNEFNTQQAIEFGMLVLLVGREARGEQYDGMLGVAYSVRNRVENPRYWGHDWISVMSHPLAYSSMVPPNADNDPNLRVYPDMSNGRWILVMEAAEAAYFDIAGDNVHGATHYYDSSLDNDPPMWAKDPSSQHIIDIGHLRFFKAN